MAITLPPCLLYSEQDAAAPSGPQKGGHCRTGTKAPARVQESRIQTCEQAHCPPRTGHASWHRSSKEQRLEAGGPPGQVLAPPSARATWPWASRPTRLCLGFPRLTRWPGTEPARHPNPHGCLQSRTWARVCLRRWP